MERLLSDYYDRTGTRLDLEQLPVLCHPGGPAILDSLKKCAQNRHAADAEASCAGVLLRSSCGRGLCWCSLSSLLSFSRFPQGAQPFGLAARALVAGAPGAGEHVGGDEHRSPALFPQCAPRGAALRPAAAVSRLQRLT